MIAAELAGRARHLADAQHRCGLGPCVADLGPLSSGSALEAGLLLADSAGLLRVMASSSERSRRA